MQHTGGNLDFSQHARFAGRDPVSRSEDIPLELFFPIPSLSTTFSLHRMRRDGDGSAVVSGVSSARNRRVAVNRRVDDSREVSVVDWEGRVVGWRVRDMVVVVEWRDMK